MKRQMIAIVFGMLLAACGGKDDNKTEPAEGSAMAAGSGSGSAGSGSAAGSAGSAAGSAGSAAEPAAAELDLPTAVDFEEEATARITEKNVDAELKAIESELAQ